jgi:sugar lactone lactonase YvrE
MNRALWMHFALALGIATIAASSAASQPAVGTISSFTGNVANMANAACAKPEGITIDLLGNFYVSSAATTPKTGAVCEFDHQGAFLRVLPVPAGPGGLVSLLGVLWQPPNTVFALDFADSLAHKGTSNGRVVAVDTVSGAVTTISTGLRFPNGFAEDLQGNLYVSDSFAGTILRMGQDGSNRTTWSADPLLSGANGVPLPIGANGIQFDALFQNMYVNNTAHRQVLRIPVGPGGTAGKAEVFADGVALDRTQSTSGALLGADGLTLDLFGYVYVAANAANEIQVLSPSGQLVARYGSTALPVDVPASPLFLGNQLYFTNVSLRNGGIHSCVGVLQTPFPGLPPLYELAWGSRSSTLPHGVGAASAK